MADELSWTLYPENREAVLKRATDIIRSANTGDAEQVIRALERLTTANEYPKYLDIKAQSPSTISVALRGEESSTAITILPGDCLSVKVNLTQS